MLLLRPLAGAKYCNQFVCHASRVHNQARREGGGRGKSFPGPRDVWGPRRHSKILKMVF